MPAVRVRPEFGPSLPELVAPRLRRLPRAARLAVLALAALLAAFAVWFVAFRGQERELTPVVIEEPIGINFAYREPLQRFTAPDGAMARVAAPGLSMTIRELRLPPYEGDVAGVMPIVASQMAREMRERYDGFLLRQEGRTNVNRQQGYELVFQFKRDDATWYGRRVMLVPEVTAQQGADILLLAERSPSVPSATSIGRDGALKTTYRSFRFGTERPK